MSSYIEILSAEIGTAATRTSDRHLTHDVRSLIINVSAQNFTGSPTFLPQIQVQMGDRFVDYWKLTRPFTGAGEGIFILHSGGASSIKLFLEPPPFSWRFILTFGGSGSADTFVGAQVLT